MKSLLPLLLAASALADPSSPPSSASGWESSAALVLTGSYGRTTAGEGYEDALASAHTDPVHEDLAFGGAELFARAGRPLGSGRLEAVAAFHVHRHPGETTESELEEIHAEWSRGALKVRAGIFYAPVGLTNTLHAHAWTFANAPLFYGRLLGEDGLRNPGAQVAWESSPGKSLWTFAIQRATGETAASFRSDHDGEEYLGRVHDAASGSGPLLTLRNERAYKFSAGHAVASGLSLATAENGSGGGARTWLAAWDLEWRHQAPGSSSWRALELELLGRSYEASAGLDVGANPVDADTFGDLAVALAATGSLARDWTAGLRLERAAPVGASPGQDEARTRVSPLLSWRAAEGLLVRLQYDHDRADSFGTEDSVWLTFQWTLGKH